MLYIVTDKSSHELNHYHRMTFSEKTTISEILSRPEDFREVIPKETQL